MNKQSEPLISVIIAAYNQEKYIGRCLRSLLHQSMEHKFFEIIVIDDGSNDRTPYALDLFHDSIVVINNKKNIGLPASINKGINRSRGKTIVRVDSDDYVNYHFLAMLHLFLESNEYYDAVACDYLLVNDSEEILRRENCIEKPIACGILFKKEQLESLGGYDESFLLHEERDLRIRFEEKYKIGRIELPLYRYRMHMNNMTNNTIAMNLHEKKLVQKHGERGRT